MSVIDQFTGESIDGINFSSELGEVRIVPMDYGFKISAPYPEKNYKIFASANGYYSRETFVKMTVSKQNSSPTNTLKIPLIPTTFSMNSFNSMVRGEPNSGYMSRVGIGSRYWVSICKKRLAFRTSGTLIIQQGQIGTNLTTSYLDNKKSELSDFMTKITPWTYRVGAGVYDFEPWVGQELMSFGSNGVTVAIYTGLTAATGYSGLGSWRVVNGQVTCGHAMVDGGASSSTLLHEVGHGMGYNHVSGSGSIMNTPSSFLAPTDFDIKSGKIIFTRSFQNRNVDRDDWKYTLGYHHLDWIESDAVERFSNEDVRIANYGENDEVFEFTIGCSEDGSEDLEIRKILNDGSSVRVGGYEKKSIIN